jgi:hypothetical protein
VKKFIQIAAILMAPAFTSAGELIITETNDHDSRVSLKVSENSLSINDSAIAVPAVVGKNENDGSPVMVGPATPPATSGFSELVALLRMDGHYYSYRMKAEGGSIRLDRGAVFSDGNCENFIGFVGLDRNRIVRNSQGDLYAISTDAWTSIDPSAVYTSRYWGDGGPCQELSSAAEGDSRIQTSYFFSADKLDITETELLNGAVPPYRVIYR